MRLEGDAHATVESARSAITEELDSVKSKPVASSVKGANSRWSAHIAAKSGSKVDDDASKALMAVSREVADATKRKIFIIVLELEDTSKRVSTQIKMESQTATLRIRTELERNDSETLGNVKTCQAVLHSSVAEACRGLLDTTDAMVGFDEDIFAVESGQIKEAESNQTRKESAGAVGTKNQ